MPGVILMPESARLNGVASGNPATFGTSANASTANRNASNQMSNSASPQTTATIAKELLDTGEYL